MEQLLEKMMEVGASDLHICTGTSPAYRINGKLKKFEDIAYSSEKVTTFLHSLLTQNQIETLTTHKELDFSFQLDQRVRFRTNYYYEKGNLAGAFRIIPAYIPTLDELGMPSTLKAITEKPRGLVLVTGPTGSGKSTTLAAFIHEINMNRAAHIVTIEDPIEYIHHHQKSIINQREIGTDTFNFSGALRSALREDPDVILIGEMRDLETIKLAITAAETGHLVFATLHTNTAAESIDRIIDVFEPNAQSQIRSQLSSNLQAVISQQLIPKQDGKGRIAAIEYMICTSGIRNLIRENKTFQIPSLIQTGASHGMVSMDQSLKQLVQSGVIHREIALEKSVHKEELAKII